MAQSLVVYSSNPFLRADVEPFRLVLDWQGDADMAVSKPVAATYRESRSSPPFPQVLKGRIAKIETVPGTNGDRTTCCPFGTYGVALLDSFGLDVLAGAGAARSVSAAEQVLPATVMAFEDELTLAIASTATADQLAGAGAFTGAATGWTLGTGWAYATNNVAKNADGTGTLSKDSFAAVPGRVYEVAYTISGWTAGTVTASLGGVSGTARGANGTYADILTASGTAGLAFTPTSTSRFTIDSITVKYADAKGRVIVFIA